MIKSKLTNGTPMFILRIDMYVKHVDFTKAITEHFYNRGEGFNKKLTKTEGMNILKAGLFFHGISGALEDGYFEASFEEGEIWNEIYSEASKWVKKNYPYLTINNAETEV